MSSLDNAPENAPEQSDIESTAPKPVSSIGLFLPLIGFLVLAGLFMVGLNLGDRRAIPSALIGKPVPAFALEAIDGLTGHGGVPIKPFSSDDLATGEVTVVNVWASWCVSCRAEHPYLEQLAKRGNIRLYGLNYKDTPSAAKRYLAKLGNPFSAIGMDRSGRVGIEWGVTGTPETFVVDGKGTIVYKHIGPISPASIEAKLLPAIAAARNGGKPSS